MHLGSLYSGRWSWILTCYTATLSVHGETATNLSVQITVKLCGVGVPSSIRLTTRFGSLSRRRAWCSLIGSARTFFWSSGRATTLKLLLSMQLLIGLLNESALISAHSLCSTHSMILSWNVVENRVGGIWRVNWHDHGCRARTWAHHPGFN